MFTKCQGVLAPSGPALGIVPDTNEIIREVGLNTQVQTAILGPTVQQAALGFLAVAPASRAGGRSARRIARTRNAH